jgi:hypothetical protein
MKAVAHLPGLDIEIVHHPSSDGLAEHISINLKAVPSFEAFARFYETMNPFVFWPRRHGLFGFLGSRPCAPPWLSKVPLRCRSVGPRSRAARSSGCADNRHPFREHSRCRHRLCRAEYLSRGARRGCHYRKLASLHSSWHCASHRPRLRVRERLPRHCQYRGHRHLYPRACAQRRGAVVGPMEFYRRDGVERRRRLRDPLAFAGGTDPSSRIARRLCHGICLAVCRLHLESRDLVGLAFRLPLRIP